MTLFKLKNIEEKLAVFAYLIMLSISFANVLSRYVFRASFAFTEELTTAFFVLVITFGGAIAAKEESHYTLDLLKMMVSEKNKRKLMIVTYVLSVVFCLSLAVLGLNMTLQQYSMGTRSIAMRLPEWIYGSFVPIGTAAMTYRFAERTIKYIKNSGGDRS